MSTSKSSDNPVRVLREILDRHNVPYDPAKLDEWERLLEQPLDEAERARFTKLAMEAEARPITENQIN